TAVDGSDGDATILTVGLLSTDTYGVQQHLEAGQYRAFMTYEGVLGLTLAGSLQVYGTDYDYTDLGEAVSGNVLDNDGLPDDGEFEVVSVNGESITGDNTVIEGVYGVLTISPDGSYTYTPNSDPSVIGQVDTFEYTVQGEGGTGTATLYVQIGSDEGKMV